MEITICLLPSNLLRHPILNHTHMWMKQALVYDLDFYEWDTSNDKLPGNWHNMVYYPK